MFLRVRSPHLTVDQHLVLLLEWFPVRHQFPGAGLIGVLVLFVECSTSITTSQRSRAGIPSIRSPASNEMISDFAELVGY